MNRPNPNREKKKPALPWVGIGIGLFFVAAFLLRDRAKEVVREIPRKVPLAAKVLPTEEKPAELKLRGGGARNGFGGGEGGGSLGSDEDPRSGERELYYCRYAEEGTYMVPWHFLGPLLSGKTKLIVMPSRESRCLKQNQSLRLAFVHVDRERAIPYRHIFDLRGTVEGLERFDNLAELSLKYPDPKVFGRESALDLSMAIARSFGRRASMRPLRVIALKMDTANPQKETYGVPPLHPLARSVKKEEIEGLRGAATIVDVRGKNDFKRAAFKEAVNIPAGDLDLKRELLSYSMAAMRLSEYAETVQRRVPKDKKVLVIGVDEQSATAYNFVHFLHSLGYRDLAYFRGGYSAIEGRTVGTPETVDGITTVDLAGARAMILGGTALLDVRSARQFSKGSIPKAVNVVYEEKLDERDYPVYRERNMTAATLAKAGEAYALPKLSGAGLVVYGSNENDWRALKAAVQARDAGVKPVYWYRKGFEDWRFFSKLQPGLEVARNRDRRTLRRLREENAKQWPSKLELYEKANPGKLPKPERGEPAVDNSYKYRIKNLVPPK